MSDDGTITTGLRAGITDDDACPYLPDRRWRNLVVDTSEHLSPELHESLLNQGFRRMGRYMYRPICTDCSECRPLRVDVRRFRASRSQRRAMRRNRDLTLTIVEPRYDEEQRELLERYLAARHEGPMVAEETSMRTFMFDSPGGTRCLHFREEGRLIGCGILDSTPNVGSSLYFYFDPEEARRSLGIFSMLVEIELIRSEGARWYHPGYYVAGCRAMSYKARLQPCEILGDDGTWRPFLPSQDD